MAKIGRLFSSLFFSGFALSNALAAEHTLMPSPQTVHVGYFSAALKPALTINSGDIVTIETVGGPDPADVDASGVVPGRRAGIYQNHPPRSHRSRPRSTHFDRAGL
jgi:hypothetical protein